MHSHKNASMLFKCSHEKFKNRERTNYMNLILRFSFNVIIQMLTHIYRQMACSHRLCLTEMYNSQRN